MWLAKKNNFIFGEKKIAGLERYDPSWFIERWGVFLVFFLHILTFLQKETKPRPKKLAVVGIASSVLFVAGKMNTNYSCPINIIATNILQNITLKKYK